MVLGHPLGSEVCTVGGCIITLPQWTFLIFFFGLFGYFIILLAISSHTSKKPAQLENGLQGLCFGNSERI